jgi:lysine 2,3-aminomutase
MTQRLRQLSHSSTMNHRYLQNIHSVQPLSAQEQERLRPISDKFAFRANDYYLNLINWDDPDDPIRQLIIPRTEELNDGGMLDASNEQSITVANGVQHKYPDTALLLCNSICGGYCRYCFRKRLFMESNDEVPTDLSAGFQYIREHPEINNVLLTGGDPLIMSTRRLRDILAKLREISHVQIIRIGSKMMAFDPIWILQNQELHQLFREFSHAHQRIYLMTHFDHPRELTAEAIAAIDCCIRNGVICLNQCPIIAGVNHHPEVLAELFEKLTFAGCQPYYVFQCRPTQGNQPYQPRLSKDIAPSAKPSCLALD